jgi:hypothetical protein
MFQNRAITVRGLLTRIKGGKIQTRSNVSNMCRADGASSARISCEMEIQWNNRESLDTNRGIVIACVSRYYYGQFFFSRYDDDTNTRSNLYDEFNFSSVHRGPWSKTIFWITFMIF